MWYCGPTWGSAVLVSNTIAVSNNEPVTTKISPGLFSTDPRDTPITVPANISEGAPEIDITWISKALGSEATLGPLPSGPTRNMSNENISATNMAAIDKEPSAIH